MDGERGATATTTTARSMRKKPAKLTLAIARPTKDVDAPSSSTNGSRSVPASPVPPMTGAELAIAVDGISQTLRGAPRRRPSVFLHTLKMDGIVEPMSAGPPTVWQDPSEHILSGNGSSLQHARSSYAAGPIEVLPGLFLGDEFNACDERTLVHNGITTILNVAKETTLPCQEDESSRELGFLHIKKRLTIHDEAATPTSSRYVINSPPQTAITERFYTPMTSSFAASLHPPQPASPIYLRNTSSTPNLLHFTVPGAYRAESTSSSSIFDEEEYEEEGESTATSSLASHVSSHTTADSAPPSPSESTTTPLSSTFSRRSPATAAASTASSSSGGSLTIALPSNAVALSVPPSPQSGRTWPIRYVKLPWTHDETDLASATSTGGFATGCALIADALGVSDDGKKRGGILVHCQCGVSRSATMVIAFVMQAAAYEYNFAQTQSLTGMHDCYEMVKNLSASISPNISLIYQLVEWERMLSSQVASFQHDLVPTSAPRRWGKELMDEEDWMRMRAEEESKEQMVQEERMREVRAREVQWRAAQEASRSALPVASTGVGARRKKPSPSLTLLSSSKANADRVLANTGTTTAALPSLAADDGEAADDDDDDEAKPAAAATATTSRSSSRPGSGYGHAAFGALGQSAAERRIKHKRTFSAEVPDWNVRQSIQLTRSKTDTSMPIDE